MRQEKPLLFIPVSYTHLADDYAKFMTADSYKTYTKAYNVFIKKNPGYEEKIANKLDAE